MKAKNYTTSAFLRKNQFQELCIQFPEVAQRIKERMSRYKDRNTLFRKSIIRNTDITDGLSDRTIEELSYGLKELFLEQGTFLFK